MEKFIGETEEFVGDSIGETVNDKIKMSHKIVNFQYILLEKVFLRYISSE